MADDRVRRVSRLAVAATIPISAASTLYYASQPRKMPIDRGLLILNTIVLAITVASSIVSYVLPISKEELGGRTYSREGIYELDEECPIMCRVQLEEERRRDEEERMMEEEEEAAEAEAGELYFEGLGRRIPATPRSLDYHRRYEMTAHSHSY